MNNNIAEVDKIMTKIYPPLIQANARVNHHYIIYTLINLML